MYHGHSQGLECLVFGVSQRRRRDAEGLGRVVRREALRGGGGCGCRVEHVRRLCRGIVHAQQVIHLLHVATWGRTNAIIVKKQHGDEQIPKKVKKKTTKKTKTTKKKTTMAATTMKIIGGEAEEGACEEYVCVYHAEIVVSEGVGKAQSVAVQGRLLGHDAEELHRAHLQSSDIPWTHVLLDTFFLFNF